MGTVYHRKQRDLTYDKISHSTVQHLKTKQNYGMIDRANMQMLIRFWFSMDVLGKRF